TRNQHSRWKLPLSYAIGVAGYALGLLLSSLFDLPSGALIVWCLAILAIGTYWLGPADALPAAPVGRTGGTARRDY
ncbi:MAG: metal ABC transporter permease, partial [Betaproteobacteria bacterium]